MRHLILAVAVLLSVGAASAQADEYYSIPEHAYYDSDNYTYRFQGYEVIDEVEHAHGDPVEYEGPTPTGMPMWFKYSFGGATAIAQDATDSYFIRTEKKQNGQGNWQLVGEIQCFPVP